MALKGLVIDRPWIGMILAGDKIWEVRSRGTAVRGRIALIEKGTGTVVGLATLADSLPALAPEQMQAHFAKHRIPPAKVAEPGFRWFTPWVLTDVRRLDRPVPYRHPSGAVTWVNLSAGDEAAILGSRRAGATSTTQPVPSANMVMPEHRVLAGRVVSQISDEAGLGIPAGASTRVRRDGSRLYIDVEWDDGLPAPRSVSGWRDVMGLFGVAGSALCALGAMIHLPLAILFSGITIFGALKWVGAMLVAMLVAVIGGHGDELEKIFGKR
ncbi:hypothetical protein [Sphingomonas hankyongi]|uniref:ASCH domain-containing protein n=1 Tax=Sphingomonas hankyongi TaxID=2908209 RepID=A0ABT0S1R5_9SPHN|nr:hypothetical protein [Sphingomonas hankyongi]MCL6729805.1 hypothetical protein [Sphingomonas hankyongi]